MYSLIEHLIPETSSKINQIPVTETNLNNADSLCHNNDILTNQLCNYNNNLDISNSVIQSSQGENNLMPISLSKWNNIMFYLIFLLLIF